MLAILLALSAAARDKPGREIRVLLGEVNPKLTIAGSGLKMHSARKKFGKSFSAIELSVSGGKLFFKEKDMGAWARVSSKAPIAINGKSYAGKIFIEKSSGRFLVINRLDLETYLEGVIKNEMSVKWPLEALKAQTVLARTYAVKKIEQPRSEKYDLAATVEDQVYSGLRDQDPASLDAIKETEGEVLFYNSQLADVFYHSCCGGRTEAAEYVWGGYGRTYLQPVKCDSCDQCPYYFWRYPETGAISPQDLADRLGFQGDAVSKIEIIDMSPSQRALKLKVELKSGRQTEISGSDFRLRLGRDLVRSTLFKIRQEPDGFIIFGSGSGHGVGLCQWGAKGMADQEKNYQEILERYFPGTKIKKIY